MKQCFHRSVYWKSIVNWELLIHVTIDVYSYFSTHFPAHSTLETPYPRSRLVAGAEGREVLTGPGGCKLRDRILLSCGNTALLRRGGLPWRVCRIDPKRAGKEDAFSATYAMTVMRLFNAAALGPDALRGYAHTRRAHHRHDPAQRGDPIVGALVRNPRARVRPVKLHARAPLAPGHYSLIVRDSNARAPVLRTLRGPLKPPGPALREGTSSGCPGKRFP